MTKKIIIGLFVLSAIVAAIIGYNSKDKENHENSLILDMYFFDDATATLVSEERAVEYTDDEEIIKNTVESIIKGPQNAKNKSILDKDTRLKQVMRHGDSVYLDFSKEFYSEDRTTDTMAAYAIVKTLCQIAGVGQVEITVDEQQLIGADGNKVGFLSGEDIIIDKESAEKKYVLLYFLNPETKKLQREAREIKMTDTQPIEQYIVNELIKGPTSPELQGVLSPDTSLISVQTTDGTCFLNFNSNFVSKNSGTKEKEDAAIYSIVSSLTELETVDNVQFLADGKKITEFGETILNKSISKNKRMLEE